jgi:hypothetical protein
MPTLLLALSLLSADCRAAAAPVAASAAPSFAALGLPAALSKARLQGLLQSFVDVGFGRSFRHLGDERDFDHGHVLLDARTRAPIAILYHTQELAHAATAPDFGYVDAAARNWIQWLDGRGVENASLYERAEYPRTASWDWFVAAELPKLRRRRTITDRMLDPARLGTALAGSVQWTFTRVACGALEADAASNVISIRLPDRALVCLALGAS